VLKKGRKGRISNELVAASCAAILAVYAAGSWRTRAEDRRFGVEGEMRRPVRPAPVPAASVPAAVAAAVSQAVAPQVIAALEPRSAPKKPVKVDPVPPPPAALAKSSEPAPAPAPAAVATADAAPATAAAVTVEAQPAPAPEATPATEADAPSRKHWLDGYYTGWGTSRHGDIQSFVRIENDRIVDAGVASCETRYPCDVIDRIIRQPIERQSADVDRVSRATESADAYYYGLVTALEHAESGTFKSARP
jgi:uncharacterized protein with FMN-binding domain